MTGNKNPVLLRINLIQFNRTGLNNKPQEMMQVLYQPINRNFFPLKHGLLSIQILFMSVDHKFLGKNPGTICESNHINTFCETTHINLSCTNRRKIFV